MKFCRPVFALALILAIAVNLAPPARALRLWAPQVSDFTSLRKELNILPGGQRQISAGHQRHQRS